MGSMIAKPNEAYSSFLCQHATVLQSHEDEFEPRITNSNLFATLKSKYPIHLGMAT